MKLPKSLDLLVEGHLSPEDAHRQKASAQELLKRLERQPGVILGDEVGMGKTFVALAVAAAHILAFPNRPVVALVPGAVLEKWERDANTFREQCLKSEKERSLFRVQTADSGIAFLKLLDDPIESRASLIVLSHGALQRKLADKWVKLAVLRAAIKGRRGAAELRWRLARFAPLMLRDARGVDEKSAQYSALLEAPYSQWKALIDPKGDDPVPEVLQGLLEQLDLSEIFSKVVEVMPQRESKNIDARIRKAREALDSNDGELHKLWRQCLLKMRLELPLLVMDEAHRTRNPNTGLAQLLKTSKEEQENAKGQLAGQFERMLFLTATPFQLGHAELIEVLKRFDAIDWQSTRPPSLSRALYQDELARLHLALNAMQLATDHLERCWKKLLPADLEEARQAWGEEWWLHADGDEEGRDWSNPRSRAVARAHAEAHRAIRQAETQLRPWVLRHQRLPHLPAPHAHIRRRERLEGARVLEELGGKALAGGLRVDAASALPFLLGARVMTLREAPRVLGESIASSFEALLDTRKEEASEVEDSAGARLEGRAAWYGERLRAAALDAASSWRNHPKLRATVDLAMHLWRRGEKVLIFCHYRQTGAVLHRHLSQAMREAVDAEAMRKLGCARTEVAERLAKLADRFERGRPAARVVHLQLERMLKRHPQLREEGWDETIEGVVLRFLRTSTFLVRHAPLNAQEDSKTWAEQLFAGKGGEDLKPTISRFLDFLSRLSGKTNRGAYLEALSEIQVGSHQGKEAEESFSEDERKAAGRALYVANVRRVFGDTRDETRKKLMLTFNTPFFPEILISSSVLGEGVDLHLNCRHVIHHDLDWNPSSLEQRTGRIDRLGAKAEQCGKPIRVYLPYVEGCQDEKLFRVVMDRERWFSVVMGAEESMRRVLRGESWELERMAELPTAPEAMMAGLGMKLGSD